MTVSQKAVLSLFLSILLFAGIAAAAYTGLFDLVETRFYNSSRVKSLIRETGIDAELLQEYLTNLQNRFAASLDEPSVRRSFLAGQSAFDIFERSRIYGLLLESVPGLHSVRFVDAVGGRIHFSTYPPDIIKEDRLSVTYRGYNEDPANPPFARVQVRAGEDFRLTPDTAYERIIFSYPFYDSLDIYRGTALFTVSVRAPAERLVSAGRLKAGEDVSLTAVPPGMVSGSPGTSTAAILEKISSIWADGIYGQTSFVSADSKTTMILVSAKTSLGFYYGRIINEDVFAFPWSMKAILLTAVFLTIYLAMFFFFNLKQDTLTVIQNRLDKLQISLIEQFYEHKGDIDWSHWIRELEQRREDIRIEIKRGIKIGENRVLDRDIDALINKSWDELLELIGGRETGGSGVIEEKTRTMLNHIPQTQVEHETLEELEVVNGHETAEPAARASGGLLAAAEKKQPKQQRPGRKPNERTAFGEDNLPRVVSESEIDKVASEIEFSPVSTPGMGETEEPINSELEVVSPFASILSSLNGVIVEQNGIPYINRTAFNPDKQTEEKLDNNFKKLVESVVITKP